MSPCHPTTPSPDPRAGPRCKSRKTIGQTPPAVKRLRRDAEDSLIRAKTPRPQRKTRCHFDRREKSFLDPSHSLGMTGLGPSPWRPLRLCASHTVSDFLDPKFGRKFQFFRVYCEGYSPPRPSALEPQPTQQSLSHHRGTEFAEFGVFLN